MDYSQKIINHIEHLKHYTTESIYNVSQSIIPELLDIQFEEVDHYFLNNNRYNNFDPAIRIFKVSNMRYYSWNEIKYEFTGYISSTMPTENIKSGELWYQTDNSNMPMKFPIQVRRYNGNAWSDFFEEYTPKTLDLWSNRLNDTKHYWFEFKWLDFESQGKYEFQQNAYIAIKHNIIPPFVLFINNRMIPLTDITIIKNHRYSYFMMRNLEKFNNQFDSMHIVYIPFGIKYSEVRAIPKDYVELFRFDDDGLYSPLGRFIYSANIPDLRVTENVFAEESIVNNLDLNIDKHYKIFPSNMYVFSDGLLNLNIAKNITNLNMLTLNNGDPTIGETRYKIFYRVSVNPNISNILVPENDTYVKQVVTHQTEDDIDLSTLEEDFTFSADPSKGYEENINDNLKYIAEYRQSLLNDILYKESHIVSYKYTGKEIKNLAKNGMLRMLRSKHHIYDTYVIIYKNNIVYENYQYLYYKANAWYMPIDAANIKDTDIFEIIYFNRVNNVVFGQNLQEDNRWITRCPFHPSELQITSDYMQHRLYNPDPSEFTRYNVPFTYEQDGKDPHKYIISLEDPIYYEPAMFTPNEDDFHCINWTLHWDANNQLQFYDGSVLAMSLQAEGKLSVNEFILPYDDDTEDLIIGNWTLHQTVYDELIFIYSKDGSEPYTAMTLNGLTGELKCDSYADNEDLTTPDTSTFIDRLDIGNGWYLAEDANGKLRFGNDAKEFSPAVLYTKEMFASTDLTESVIESQNYEPTENVININPDWQFYAENAFQLVIIYKRMSKVIIHADGTVNVVANVNESYNTTDYSYAGKGTGLPARINKKHPVGKDWYIANDTKNQLRFMCHETETISILNKQGQLYLNEMLNQNFAECYVSTNDDDIKIGDWVIHHNDLEELMFVHQDIIPASFNANGEIRVTEYHDNEDLTTPDDSPLDVFPIGNGWSILESKDHILRFVQASSTESCAVIHPNDYFASSDVHESDENPIDYSEEIADLTQNILKIGRWAFYAKNETMLCVLYDGISYINIYNDGLVVTLNGILEGYAVKVLTPYPSESEFRNIGPWRIYAADQDNLKFLFKDYCILTITSQSQYILPGFFSEYLNKIVKVRLIPMQDKGIKLFVDDKPLYSPMYVTRDKYVTIRATYEDSIKGVNLYIKPGEIEELRGEMLWFSSKNQFRYICYNNKQKNAAFDLGYDFRECLDISRYMVCINGKALNDTMFRILLPGKDNPFTESCVHTSVMVYPGDRVEVFYLPCPCKTIDVNNFDKVTTEEVAITDIEQLTYDIPFPIPNYTAGRNGFVVLVGNKIISPKDYIVENDKITFKDKLEGSTKIVFIFFYNEHVTEETYDEEDLPNMEQYGYIYIDKNKLSHALSRDLYFLFINGKKVDKDSILDITSNLFRVKRDIRSRTHIALLDHTVHIPELEELNKIISRYDLTMNRVAYEYLNKLFKKYHKVSDTDPRLLNNISQEALINDIVRYHYTSQAFAHSMPFIFNYDTKYYTDKDIYGNFIITTMDANNQHFPNYPHN